MLSVVDIAPNAKEQIHKNQEEYRKSENGFGV